MLDGEVLACSYYWQGDDPLATLSVQEQRGVENLAQLAARRLAARYVAIDVGQLENGAWVVIESGGPQFSGFSQIAPLKFWHRLQDALQARF
ncbi:MAG: ATP-grasp domain-containing protein [Armatimonadetes bacterium]|nr:ATP-grasp domain-containing protein [Armatimonadota bacterium]